MSIPNKKYDADIPDGHAFAATHGWWRDKMIRDFGFTIHSRRRGRSPIWTRCGQLFDEAEVLDLIAEEREYDGRTYNQDAR